MASKKKGKKTVRKQQRLKRDKVGDLFAVAPSDTEEGSLRISFRRNWYSPPISDDGTVDYEAAASELTDELVGGTIVLRNYLENGDLSYATEVHVDSKDELERVIRTIRKVYVEGLKQDNLTRQKALEQCNAKLRENEVESALRSERRQDLERRNGDRRSNHRFGQAIFRKGNRRTLTDRRCGGERRVSTA